MENREPVAIKLNHGGPADGAYIRFFELPSEGFLLYWQQKENLKYTRDSDGDEVLSAWFSGIKMLDPVDEYCQFNEKNKTHVYVFSLEYKTFVYAGLYPISNPLKLGRGY